MGYESYGDGASSASNSWKPIKAFGLRRREMGNGVAGRGPERKIGEPIVRQVKCLYCGWRFAITYVHKGTKGDSSIPHALQICPPHLEEPLPSIDGLECPGTGLSWVEPGDGRELLREIRKRLEPSDGNKILRKLFVFREIEGVVYEQHT